MAVETIPRRLQRRPRDRRGYVIPFAQFVGKDGEPQFQVMDDQKTQHCLAYRLCGLCGEQMGRHVFFVGGELCVTNGLFYDPPMHRECAEYALQACPHLARTKGRYGRIPEPAALGAARVAVGAMCSDEKADVFALMHGERYTFVRDQSGMLLIRAQLPWRTVIYYREGKPCPQP
jgi:hypothetical protein